MALSTLRLRRALLLSSAYLRQAPLAAAPYPPPSGVHSPDKPGRLWLPILFVPSASFRSSLVSSSSRFRDEDDKISPDTILFEGCDYNHWLITMDFPKDPKPTPEEMVETYVQTCAKGLNISIEEAKKKIYACSTTTYQGFQAVMTEEESEKFRDLPGVVFILPDSYIDPVNKEYGGDKYINGTIIPRPPPIQYGRQRRDRFQNDRQRRDSLGDGRGFAPQQNYGPPGQNDGRGFVPPSQNDGRGYAQQPQHDGMGYGPPGQNDARVFGSPRQNDGRGYPQPPQHDGRGYGQPGQFDGRGTGPPGHADSRGYGPPGHADNRGYGPPGGGNFTPSPQGSPPPYGGGYSQGERGSFTPQGTQPPRGYSQGERGSFTPQATPPPYEGGYNQADRGNFTPQGRPDVRGDNRGMGSPPVGDYGQGGAPGYSQNYGRPGVGQSFDGDYRQEGSSGYSENYGRPSEVQRFSPVTTSGGMQSEQFNYTPVDSTTASQGKY